MPWDRFLNLVYHFAVRNASKDKKREFDTQMNAAVSRYNLETMALTRRNALSGPESDETSQGVPQAPAQPNTLRNAKLPPRPAGWGDAETITRQSLAAAQSLRVGNGTR